MMAAPKLRTQIELEQPLPTFQGFTKSTVDATALTVLDVSTVTEEANRITFVVELGDLYINFGGDATSDGTSMLVPSGTGYSEDNIRITGIISVMRAGTTNGRIRGGVWCR